MHSLPPALEKLFDPLEAGGRERHTPNSFSADQTRPAYSVFVPDLGSLNENTVKGLDENKKIAIDFVLKEISRQRDRGIHLDWDLAQNIFMQANYLRSTKDDHSSQSIEGRSKEPSTLWSSVLDQKKPKSEDVCRLLASVEEAMRNRSRAGIAPSSNYLAHFKSDDVPPKNAFLSKGEYQQNLWRGRTVVEVGCLSFPDSETKHFAITRVRIIQRYKTSITTEYVKIEFAPRPSMIARIESSQRTSIAQGMEKAFISDRKLATKIIHHKAKDSPRACV